MNNDNQLRLKIATRIAAATYTNPLFNDLLVDQVS